MKCHFKSFSTFWQWRKSLHLWKMEVKFHISYLFFWLWHCVGFCVRWSPAPWDFTSSADYPRIQDRLRLITQIVGNQWIVSSTDTCCHSTFKKPSGYVCKKGVNEIVSILLLGASTTMKTPQGYSTVYYAQNNSRACEIMLANGILTLLCLYLRLWSVGSGEKPKM